jgi:hypothetical protein
VDGDHLDVETEAVVEAVRRTSFPFFGLEP